MTNAGLSFLIADDHPIVLQGMIKLIKDEYPGALIIEASNGNEVLEKVRKVFFNLLILDISMPGKNGIEILKQLKAEEYKMPVLFLSMYPEDQYAVRAIKAGAYGYLPKSSAPEELTHAIRTILSGKKFIPFSLAENLATAIEKNFSEQLHETLSDREFDVLKQIASGKTVSQVAEDLSLSAATVSTYRARILEKMNMKTNAELTNYAIKNGLVDL